MYEPKVFAGAECVRAALSLRGVTRLPFGFNMSQSVGDSEHAVIANRSRLAGMLGFPTARLAIQSQVHGDSIVEVGLAYTPGDGDSMVTNSEGWLLGVSVADCVPILLYDDRRRAIAAVHSGWRGSNLNVVAATIARLGELYFSDAIDLRAYVGAAASQCCYVVGEDVARLFDARHSRAIGRGKYLFDNKGVVLEQLVSCGLQPHHIELDVRCTICNPNFHSFRRDGSKSGRMLAVIGMNTCSTVSDRLETA